MIATGNFLFRYRNAIFPLTCMLLLLPGPRLFENPLWAAALGAHVAGIGQSTRALTIGLRYIVRGGRGGKVYADDLVTSGLYQLCRNPMYVGNLLIVTGLAIASNSLTTLLCALPLAGFVYMAIVAAEENYLSRKFGAGFAAYCRDVPRWLPQLSAVPGALTSCAFHWRRVIAKEYGTPFGWICTLCLIALYNLWQAGTLDDYRPAATALIAVIVLACGLWFTARILKKSRRLVAD